MGAWKWLNRIFGLSKANNIPVSENISGTDLTTWVLHKTEAEAESSSFQMQADNYIKSIKSIQSLAGDSEKVVWVLVKNFLMSRDFGKSEVPIYPIFDFVVFHDEICTTLQTGNFGGAFYTKLNEITNSFENYLMKSKLRTLYLMRERSDRIVDYCESITSGLTALNEKQNKMESAQNILNEKKRELDVLDYEIQGDSVAWQEIKRLRTDELRYVEEVKSLFSRISPLLVEFTHTIGSKHSKIVQNYMVDSVTSLTNEDGLYILQLFDSIREAVLDEKIGKNMTDIEVMLIEMKRVDLVDKRDSLLEIYRKLTILSSDNNVLLQSKKDDLQYRISHFSSQAKKLQEQVQQMENRLADLKELRIREISLFENMALKGLEMSIKVVIEPDNKHRI